MSSPEDYRPDTGETNYLSSGHPVERRNDHQKRRHSERSNGGTSVSGGISSGHNEYFSGEERRGVPWYEIVRQKLNRKRRLDNNCVRYELDDRRREILTPPLDERENTWSRYISKRLRKEDQRGSGGYLAHTPMTEGSIWASSMRDARYLDDDDGLRYSGGPYNNDNGYHRNAGRYRHWNNCSQFARSQRPRRRLTKHTSRAPDDQTRRSTPPPDRRENTGSNNNNNNNNVPHDKYAAHTPGESSSVTQPGGGPPAKSVEHINWTAGMRLLHQYEVLRELGEGTFGKVLECYDHERRRIVAIKVVRAGASYADAARFEVEILKTVTESDVDTMSACVVFYDSFIYKEKHVCIVTERLGMSLYDFLAKNCYRGFSLSDIQVIAKDVLRSLAFMRAIHLTHTDLKPENILLVDDRPLPVNCRSKSEEWPSNKSSPNFRHHHNDVGRRDGTWRERMRPRQAHVKIIDFGSATLDEDEHSSLINTRQYRAPEVILDLGWNESSDMWSFGCVLAELYTGHLLFRTHEHMEHLAMIERVIGPFPIEMLERAHNTGGAKYVTDDGRLLWPQLASSAGSVGKVARLEPLEIQLDCPLELFSAFVREILVIDPQARPHPMDMLRHRFLTENLEFHPRYSSGSSS